ncbi:DUF3618 domain-containing protein [Jatrophihabitans fulvus]
MAERSADDIKRDIERSRAQLATAVDQLAYRTHPKRVAERAKQTVREKLQTPQGQAIAAGAGGVVLLLVALRIRNARAAKPRTVVERVERAAKKARR